jgi:galactose oxidase
MHRHVVARWGAGPGGLAVVLVIGLFVVVGTTRGEAGAGHGHGMHMGGSMPMVAVPASAYAPTAPELDRTAWRASSPSLRSSAQARRRAHLRAMRSIDGRVSTAWRSPGRGLPRSHAARLRLRRLTIDTRAVQIVSALQYTPSRRRAGRIERYVVRVSRDRRHWTTVTRGLWARDAREKTSSFRPVAARYVQLSALTVAGGGQVAAVAELHLLGKHDELPPTTTPTTSPTTSPTDLPTEGPSDPTSSPTATPTEDPPGFYPGSWSVPIGLPIVPASAVLLPHDKVLTFSGITATSFSGPRLTDDTTGRTQVSILDLDSQAEPGQREVADTHHEMFCTGLSILADGRVVISGGSDAPRTTIYDPRTDTFSPGPDLQVPRGYQTTVTLSDGRVFTVGGSWANTEPDKVAEVLGATAQAWSELPGISAVPIETDDSQGQFRADNHAWLFADSGGSVFHAGPSSAMHWFDTSGSGSVQDAGDRADSPAAMNGNAVMYDVGKILTLGGARDYGQGGVEQTRQPRQFATDHAYTIDISAGPGSTPTVKRVGDLHHARTFANSVVLPDGSVVTTGGQGYAIPFGDNDSVLTPELWNPTTGQFTELADEAIPRNYHSFSLLLQDGRVLAGGGGLCGDCTTNHPDAEILTPPYLLKADGTLRARPSITGGVPETTHAGSTLTVTTDRPVTSFALVRVGSSTHSVASDQRRIPLVPDQVGPDTYAVTIPSDRGITVPGPYLLFALDTFGTPSVARWVDIP